MSVTAPDDQRSGPQAHVEPQGAGRRLLFLVTEDWYFHGHRLDLAVAARAAGYRVAVATRVREHGERIRSAGIELFPVRFDRAGRNPFTEAKAALEIVRVYRAFRPDIVHHVAMKPVLYGTLAARLLRVPCVVNALTGLGYLFSSRDRLASAIRPLVTAGYRLALRRGHTIVQNRNDLEFLAQSGVIDRADATLIYGAGVDLKAFTPSPEPPDPVVIVLPSRMLRDKGVEEFVEAARMLKVEGVRARFVLAGRPDPANPASIPEARLREWAGTKIVDWLGWRDDMAAVYRAAHIVCLPSYREGLPKALLEAAACGRPIVTTDVPGCREAIIHGESGLLVAVRDPTALAAGLKALIVDGARRRSMGRRGRELASERFSIERVATETIALYQRLTSMRNPGPVVHGVTPR